EQEEGLELFLGNQPRLLLEADDLVGDQVIQSIAILGRVRIPQPVLTAPRPAEGAALQIRDGGLAMHVKTVIPRHQLEQFVVITTLGLRVQPEMLPVFAEAAMSLDG